MELRDLLNEFKISAQGEEMTNLINYIHEHIKDTLEFNTKKYKLQIDQRRRAITLKVETKYGHT